jgi:prepilin-type N-terminal cleavage/methylation domain-containing protein
MRLHHASARLRPGFTLIELLVVIGIIAILASLLLMVNLRVGPAQRTAQGASQLQGWLMIAKQRAYRDRAPRGVRFIQDGDGYIRSLVYVEQPDDFYGVGHPNTTPMLDGAGNPVSQISFTAPAGTDFTNHCRPNDLLLIGKDLYRITNLTNAAGVPALPAPAPQPNPPTPPVPHTFLITPPLQADVYNTFPYRIIRGPRDVEGEEVMKMPVDVVVDPDPFGPLAASYAPNQPPRPPLPGALTIVFLPGGGVMQEPLMPGATGPAGYIYPSGKFILYVRDPTLGTPYEGEPTLITVYTRTGAIAAHPVNQSSPTNPWLFTQDGQSSGM